MKKRKQFAVYKSPLTVEQIANSNKQTKYRWPLFFVPGLNLLDIIHNLRNEEDDDLIIQCDVFDDEKTADDESLAAEMALELDVNNHRAVFDAVFQKVQSVTSEVYFIAKSH